MMDITNLSKEKFREMFSKGIRFDNRGLLEFRDLDISFNVSNKAEGSARVKLGKTEVIAGVKMQSGEPYPDSPNKGNLMVSGDLLPLASPRFEQGPPGFEAIELPRLVDRAIRASELIDFSKLVIKSGEKVWTVIIDIYPINDDGNLIDAATIAAFLALKKARLPGLDENNNVDYKIKTNETLPLSSEIVPLSFSFFKLGDSIILDPTREEQEACDARVTFGISKWNGQYMMNSCQKVGKETFTSEELEMITSILSKSFEELDKKLKNFI